METLESHTSTISPPPSPPNAQSPLSAVSLDSHINQLYARDALRRMRVQVFKHKRSLKDPAAQHLL